MNLKVNSRVLVLGDTKSSERRRCKLVVGESWNLSVSNLCGVRRRELNAFVTNVNRFVPDRTGGFIDENVSSYFTGLTSKLRVNIFRLISRSKQRVGVSTVGTLDITVAQFGSGGSVAVR